MPLTMNPVLSPYFRARRRMLLRTPGSSPHGSQAACLSVFACSAKPLHLGDSVANKRPSQVMSQQGQAGTNQQDILDDEAVDMLQLRQQAQGDGTGASDHHGQRDKETGNQRNQGEVLRVWHTYQVVDRFILTWTVGNIHEVYGLWSASCQYMQGKAVSDKPQREDVPPSWTPFKTVRWPEEMDKASKAVPEWA